MDAEGKKSGRYTVGGTAVGVHGYAKLSRTESPRSHTSPTSLLRKFPHSLRHDQRYQVRIKRNSTPLREDAVPRPDTDRSVKSWCAGEEKKPSPTCESQAKEGAGVELASSTPTEHHPSEPDLAEPNEIVSVIVNAIPGGGEEGGGGPADRTSRNKRLLSPAHKSTPNLLRDEAFGFTSSFSQPDRLSGRTNRVRSVLVRERSGRGSGEPWSSSDSLNRKCRVIQSILPKITRTISESHESVNSPRKHSHKVLRRSESQVHGDRQVARYPVLTTSKSCFLSPSEHERSDEEGERANLIENYPNIVIQSAKDRDEGKTRWSYKKATIMPSLKGLMRKGRRCEDTPRLTVPVGSCSSLNVVAQREDDNMKKCETVYALSSLLSTDSPVHLEPIRPVNRLRVPPNAFGGSHSRMCSRCSSLLSMASSSRYSINTTGSGFAACSPGDVTPEPIMLCKLCLMEVPLSQAMEIDQCGCVFCRDCMRLYVEFEIQEGAYDISCPDAQCNKQGTVTMAEVETLVAVQMMERYRRFRLNHEVDMDRNRTWCPRAGCETVCDICTRERCEPTSVHCHTCDSDFCSNCKNPWHEGLTCEENSKKLAKEGREDFMEPAIPFDSDSIKCCPMCNVPIEKDEGCAQMMCKRCKHVFCWYCLASLDDDFLLRHYDKGPCKNKLGHSRASVIWHRTQVIGIFAGFGILLLVASPLLLLAAPCIVCCKCRVCGGGSKLDSDDDLTEESGII